MVGAKRKRFRFSDAERNQVQQAVKDAEKGTSGEIVPWIVPSCKGYRWVHGLLALAGIAVSTSALAMSHRHAFWEIAFLKTVVWQGAGACGGLLLSLIPAVRRALVPRAWLAEEAHQRSLASFVAANLTETQDRNGVLVFVALFERRVHILADRGIHEKVPEGFWSERVQEIVSGIHRGQAVPTLCEAIGKIGKILAEKFPASGTHVNQLSDDLRE